jgi:pimeloyl-ACP methyl ester carboxylesterase
MRSEDFAADHRTATIGTLRMHWVERGDPNGTPVLLLHGFPENWWSWRHQIDALSRAGFRVIAPDQRGYGQTDRHGPYDVATLLADLRGLLAHLGVRRAHVVGHDWGGNVAWFLAGRHPELVERLTVINCPHPKPFRRALLGGSLRQMRRSWYMFMFQLPKLPEAYLRRDAGRTIDRVFWSMAVDKSAFPREEIEPFRQQILEPGAAEAMVGWYRAALQGRAPQLPDVVAPSLLIWGMEDKALGFHDVVPGTERFVRDLSIVPVERAGHFVQTEAKDRVNALLLAWLTRGEVLR